MANENTLIERGFKSKENILYGKVNNYLVQVFYAPRNKYLMFPLPSITSSQKKEVALYLKDHRSEFKIIRFNFDNTVLMIKIKGSMIDKAQSEHLYNIMVDVTEFLKENNINLGQYCIFCGKENAHKLIKIFRVQYYAHNDCYENAMKETDEEMKRKEKSQKVSSDTKQKWAPVTALIAALLLFLPWIIGSIFVWYAFPLTIIVPGFTYQIYRKYQPTIRKGIFQLLTSVFILSFLIASTIIILISGVPFVDVFTGQSKLTLNIILALLVLLYGYISQIRFIRPMIEK